MRAAGARPAPAGWPASARPRPRRPLGDQPGVVVTAGREHGSAGSHDQGSHSGGRRHPPADRAEGPVQLGPADRREPAKPARAAGPAESPVARSRNATSSDSARPRAVPRALRDLGGDAARRRTPARSRRSRRPSRSTGRPGSERDRRHRHGDADHQVRVPRPPQRRRPVSWPPHDGGTDQLEPPGFLVGAGVPDHHENAHQRGPETEKRRDAPGGQRAERGAVERSVKRRAAPGCSPAAAVNALALRAAALGSSVA